MELVFFPLHPDTPASGRSLETMFAGRGYDLAAMHQRMADLMRAEGLAYGERTHTYNSRLAQELGKWAESRSAFETIHDRLFRAYFVEGRNIGDVDELVSIAVSTGLPADEARRVLNARLFSNQVDGDWQRSMQSGVTGVPTFVADGRSVIGAQPYDALAQLVRAAGARPARSSPHESSQTV